MTHIINEDLFEDRRDYTIAKLRETIEHFKSYDERRKEYYADLIKENEWMKEELSENGITDIINKYEKTIKELQGQIKSLKGENNSLRLKLKAHELDDKYTEEELAEWSDKVSLGKRQKKWEKMLEENKRLRDSNNQLISQLLQIRKDNEGQTI